MEHEVHALRERAKELRCLYRVGSATADRNESPPEVFERVLAAMPDGWQRPDDTGARIRYLGRNYDGRGYSPSRHILSAPISTFGAQVGTVEVADRAFAGEGDPFLPEERELITCIAGRLAEYLEWKQQELGVSRIGAGSEHWRWRARFAERIAAAIDPARFGVERLFLHGSTQSGSAGPASDIDLIAVFTGTEAQRRELELWLEGWSLCLAEVAYQHAGTRVSGGLLEVKIVSEAPPRSEVGFVQELRLGPTE